MSCCEELEGVLSSLSPHLKDCTMAIYNGSGKFSGADIQVLCGVAGAKCNRIFTVSSVSRSIGNDID